jgi:hypothetical protein
VCGKEVEEGQLKLLSHLSARLKVSENARFGKRSGSRRIRNAVRRGTMRLIDGQINAALFNQASSRGRMYGK